MFATVDSRPIRPSLGFWVSEGFAPGLTLAGYLPSRGDAAASDEVHVERGGHIGRLLRYVFPSDIADSP